MSYFGRFGVIFTTGFSFLIQWGQKIGLKTDQKNILKKVYSIATLRVGGGDVGQAHLPERGRDEGEADGAEGDGDAT